ncbi:glycosyltransferase [Gilvimarinus agarilyticus]|uniref:glycosyltransferase n=1 Tax=Gilvimarinus agarilyticus TaxID=679259 RepID=UPI0005A05CE9|nr:glycosyltransferase [Gilvimarinus agarilyticus]
MAVSVCMASYNGAPFIAAQLTSILAELALEDELIVVDDHSSDKTVSIIRAQQDSRIKLHQNVQQLGHVASFAKAMSLAKGDIIALADQDDVWPENRLAILKAALTPPGCLVTAGNFTDIDEQGKTLNRAHKRQLNSADSQRWLANLWGILQGKRPYYGCAMAFKRTLCDQILPIPNYVESHDLWIAMAGNINKGMAHLDASVLAKRQHATNVSSQKRRPWQKILISRLGMVAAIITLALRRLTRGRA